MMSEPEPLFEYDINRHSESIEKRQWRHVVYSIKFLRTESLDDIIKLQYPDDKEKLELPRDEKIELVRRIANEKISKDEKNQFLINNKDELNDIYNIKFNSKPEINKAAIGSGIGAGAYGAALGAIGFASSVVAGSILAPVVGIAAGIGTFLLVRLGLRSKNKHNTIKLKNVSTLAKSEIERELKYDLEKKKTI